MTVKQLVKTAIFLAVIVVLQIALMPLPNIQLTTMLFVLFFTFNKRTLSLILILSYTAVMGIMWGFTIWLIPVAVVWIIALVIFELLPTTNEYWLALKGILMAVTFGVTYGLFTWAVFGIGLSGFIAYMAVDLVFEGIMAVCNFLTILLIYPRLKDLMILLGEKPRV